MTEALWVPERCLSEVIAVIRAGLGITQVTDETKQNLERWCNEEEAYQQRQVSE